MLPLKPCPHISEEKEGDKKAQDDQERQTVQGEKIKSFQEVRTAVSEIRLQMQKRCFCLRETLKEGAHLYTMTLWAAHMHKGRGKKTCCMVVDSHFLRSKPTKCMEIVSNPTIMDVSLTMGSYGPSSVLLAVIALLLRATLSAAEIGKAHRKQAVAAIHTSVCIQKRSERKEWWLSELDISDLRPAVDCGNGPHDKGADSLHLKERWRPLA